MHHLSSESFDDETYSKFCTYIHQKTGIVVNDTKKIHLSNRLRKRIKDLRLGSFRDYWNFLNSSDSNQAELYMLFDSVSTNETYFQRGTSHFKILSHIALPDLASNRKKINIWSCGTSTGEESYDLAILALEFESQNPNTDILITGTDISHRVLEIARTGEYADRRINQLAMSQVKKYFDEVKPEASTIPYGRYVLRVKDLLKEKVTFNYLNLISDSYIFNVDIIFCRNVLIYFDRRTQQDIVDKLSMSLNHGGYLFIGHSESLQLVPNDLVLVKTEFGSVYKKETC